MRIATLTHCEIHVVTHLGIYDGNAKHTGEFWVRTLEGKFVTRDGLTRADQDATTWFTAYADAFKAASLVGSQQAGQISVELDLSGVHSDYARGCAESSVNNAVAALQPLGKRTPEDEEIWSCVTTDDLIDMRAKLSASIQALGELREYVTNQLIDRYL